MSEQQVYVIKVCYKSGNSIVFAAHSYTVNSTRVGKEVNITDVESDELFERAVKAFPKHDIMRRSLQYNIDAVESVWVIGEINKE